MTLANEDGTGGLNNARQGIARPSVETAAQRQVATPGKEERERDTARRAPENHRTCNNTAGGGEQQNPKDQGQEEGSGDDRRV